MVVSAGSGEGVIAAVEIFVLLLAIVAAWMSLRPSPPLDWERLWKMILATVIRGEVEAGGGDVQAWWDRLIAVPYHPAGRHALGKLAHPALDDIVVPALEGERALVERLVAKQTVSERWEEMYRNDPLAEESLTSDPGDLGASYDPSTPLAPNIEWEDIARWTSAVQSSIGRRMSDVVVAVLGMDSTPLISAVPHARVVSLAEVEDVGQALLDCCQAPQERLVIVAQGQQVQHAVRALHANPTLRDRVLTVLGVAADWSGSEEWLENNFEHQAFDTELNRRTPYMAISDIDLDAMVLRKQTFPDPVVPPSGWAPIESVDLGFLPLTKHDPDQLARALWVLVCFCLSSR